MYFILNAMHAKSLCDFNIINSNKLNIMLAL